MSRPFHFVSLWFLALSAMSGCSSRQSLELDRSTLGEQSLAPSESSVAVITPPSEQPAPDCAHQDESSATADAITTGSIHADAGEARGPSTTPGALTTTSTPTCATSSPAASSAAAPSSSSLPILPPLAPTPGPPAAPSVAYTVLVSVDGLASRYLEAVIAAGNAPTFAQLQSRAAWTHNARTDKTYTITLPNHTCMLTGLPVSSSLGFDGFRAHFYTSNTDPARSEVLHTLRYPARDYTPSVFDVVHDHGFTTAMFASKTKFSLYTQSYNEAGRADTIGTDNGRRKIDTVVINTDPPTLIDQLVSQLTTAPPAFTFVHLNQPDATGHGIGWGSPEYLTAVAQMDALVGRILAALDSGPMAARSALIVTTDHGGIGTGHFDSNDPLNFQIPFYVMAPGVLPGDAYAAFENRFAPGLVNPEYHDPEQPLRNGDSGNLALHLLGLPPVPESIIHSAGILTGR
jgi:Type I phosphodiesterase / nucleotide pyrophosphatase